MVQQIIAILLGFYLLSESIAAAALMHGGDRLCRVAKYLLTGLVGICLITEFKSADGLHLLMAAALCLFVWPKMLARIEQLFDQLIGD
jgi:hypothetical protein